MNCYPKDKHYHDGFLFYFILLNKKSSSTQKKKIDFLLLLRVGGFGIRKKGMEREIKKNFFF